MLKEFSQFVRDKGVIGLAVAFIIGAAVTKLVTALVEDLINPVIGILIGKAGNLANYEFIIPGTTATIKYGNLISVLIDFLIILLVVYILFVKSPLNKLDKKKEEEKK